MKCKREIVYEYFEWTAAVFIVAAVCCLINVVDSSCPHLKPNKNVLVICKNGQQSGGRIRGSQQWFKCNPTNAQVNTGTIAIYQCDKYFKPTSRRLNGGKMQCTDKGVWSNMRAFKDFRCELECGKQSSTKNSLISFGNNTDVQTWPWVATIYRIRNDEFLYSCGGSLIGLKTIITAAHCVTDGKGDKIPISWMKIVLGSVSSNFTVNRAVSGATVYSVRDVHIHPDYHAETLTSDMAIIELEKSARLTDSVLPICLPLNYEHDALILSPDNFGEVASFGTDETGKPANTLQYAKIPIISSANCHAEIKIIPRTEQFCAGQSGGPNICRGDSGSGMVFRSLEYHENKYVIHGIVSNTGQLLNGCAPVVVFSKVFEYIRWIHEILLVSENSDREEQVEQSQPKPKPGLALDKERDSEVSNSLPPKKGPASSSGCSHPGALCFPPDPPPKRHISSTVTATSKPNLPKQPNVISGQGSSSSISSGNTNSNNPMYTKSERIALSLFRPLVENILLEDYMHTDEYLIKWLRAKELNLDEAQKFLQADMNWRKINLMNEILNEDFKKFQKDYTIFFQGFDKGGRPIATTLLGQYDLRKIAESGEINQFKRYLSRNCEEIARRVRDVGLKNVTQSVAIFDLYGYNSRKHLCSQCFDIYRYFIRQHETHFPQENYVTYFINMPDGFDHILHVIRPFFSEHTKRTIHFYGTNRDEWSKELLKQIPADQLFKVYGGTKTVKPGSERVQLAL